MSEDLAARLSTLIDASVQTAHDLKVRHGFDPAPNSQGGKEREAESVAGGRRLIVEAS